MGVGEGSRDLTAELAAAEQQDVTRVRHLKELPLRYRIKLAGVKSHELTFQK